MKCQPAQTSEMPTSEKWVLQIYVLNTSTGILRSYKTSVAHIFVGPSKNLTSQRHLCALLWNNPAASYALLLQIIYEQFPIWKAYLHSCQLFQLGSTLYV